MINETQKEELKNEIKKAKSILSMMGKQIEVAPDEETKKMAKENYEMFEKHVKFMEGIKST
jgi:hypothetical protein